MQQQASQASSSIHQLRQQLHNGLKNIGKGTNHEKTYNLVAQLMTLSLKKEQEGQLRKIFQSFYSSFYRQSKEEHYCGKEFTKHNSKVFICYDCAIECNSVQCFDCFEKETHKGHRYESFDVDGGTCDCGDQTKWRKQTFCKKHQYKKDLKETIAFGDDKKETFLEYCDVFLHILYCLYFTKKALQAKKDQENQLFVKELTRKADLFGSQFITQLRQINKDQFGVNSLTRTWMKTTIRIGNNPFLLQDLRDNSEEWQLIKEVKVEEELFRFYDLEQTAKNCQLLFLSLFYRADSFRRQITILFIKEYSRSILLSSSPYAEFSPQVLSSSSVLKHLLQIDHKKFNKAQNYGLLIFPELTNIKDELSMYYSKEEAIKKICQSYRCYYSDIINYLLEVNFETFRLYWKMFELEKDNRMRRQGDKVTEWSIYTTMLSHHYVLADDVDWLRAANKGFYEIEEIALEACTKILKKMRVKEDKSYVFRNTQRIFWKHIRPKQKTSQTNNKDDFPSPPKNYSLGQDLFFTEHRMFSLFLFFELTHFHSPVNLRKFKRELIQDYIQRFQIKEKQFVERLYEIARKVIINFRKISDVMINNETTEDSMRFAQVYFKSPTHPNFLFSLDAFLLKFAISFLMKLEEEQKEPSSIYKIQNFVNTQMNAFFSRIDAAIAQYKDQTNNNFKCSRFKKIQDIIYSMHKFLNLIEEALFSDNVELVLATECLKKCPAPFYEQKFKNFYKKLLVSMRSDKDGVELQKFYQVCNDAFFRERDIFQKFVKEHRNPKNPSHLSVPRAEEANFNYCSVEMYLLNDLNHRQFMKEASWKNTPFDLNSMGGAILPNINYYHKLQEILKNELEKIPQSYQFLINTVVRELYKFTFLTKNKEYNDQFRALISTSFTSPNIIIRSNAQPLLQWLQEDLRNDIKIQYNIDNNNNPDAEPNIHDPNDYNYPQINPTISSIDPSLQQSSPVTENSIFKELSVDLYEQKKCMFGNKCQLKNNFENQHQLLWLCYGRYTNAHSLYTIEMDERILTLSSCGDCCHQECFDKYIRNQQLIYKCIKCNSRFNLLLTAQNLDLEPISNNEIKKDFNAIQQLTKSYRIKINSSIEEEIFKSIILFIVNFVSVNDFDCFRYNIFLYRNLYKKLKERLKRDKQLNSKLTAPNQKLIKTESTTTFEHKLIQEIASILRDNNYTILLDNTSTINSIETSIVDVKGRILSLINFFMTNSTGWKIIEPPRKYLPKDNITALPAWKLPSTLKEFNQKSYTCSICKKQHQHSYFISMLPHYRKQFKFCICHQCAKDHLKTYLSQDHQVDEALFIETDTGKIFYFCLSELKSPLKQPLAPEEGKQSQKNRYMLKYCADSVYRNSFGSPFETGKGFKRQKFLLSQQSLNAVYNNLVTWNFVKKVDLE